MKTIAFLNQKGGVGKTTTTINVGVGLARLKKKVLLIDFDPQGSLSCSLGIESPSVSMYDFITRQELFENVVIKSGKLSVMPATISLSAFDKTFQDASGREMILKKALSCVKDFDFILIDCPPSLGLLTINALTASQEVYIPIQVEFLALQGLGQLLDTLGVITKRINKALKIGGIIGTRYNRRKINKDVMEYLKENFKGKTLKTVIRENVALAEAPSFGKDIYSYKPKSIGAHDYYALCKEILAREVTI